MKKFNTIEMVIVFIIIISSVAIAKVGTEAINITYRNIKVYLDNREVSLKDANGNIVEPFIIDGTTYLPLRAVSEALDLKVDWEEEDSSIFIYSNIKPTKEENDEKEEIVPTETNVRPETRREVIARYIKEYNELNPDYMISQIYWEYGTYIKFMKDGIFIDVYYDNDRIKAVVTENTYFDKDDETRKDLSKRIATKYNDVIYYLAKVGNEDIARKSINKIYSDLEEGKYGSSLINNIVEFDNVTISYYNQSGFFSTTIEFDYERLDVPAN